MVVSFAHLSNKNKFKNKIISFKEGRLISDRPLTKLKTTPYQKQRIEVAHNNEGWNIQFQVKNELPRSQLFDAVYSTIPAHKNHSLPLNELAKNDLPDFSTLEHPPVSVLSRFSF